MYNNNKLLTKKKLILFLECIYTLYFKIFCKLQTIQIKFPSEGIRNLIKNNDYVTELSIFLFGFFTIKILVKQTYS